IRLSDFLCRSPAQLAVLTARCDLGFAARSAAGCAEPRGHPAARAKNAFKYRGHVEVGMKLRPMQAETGRRDFDRGKLLAAGVFKPLCIAWREAHVDAGVQAHDDPIRFPIIMRGDS